MGIRDLPGANIRVVSGLGFRQELAERIGVVFVSPDAALPADGAFYTFQSWSEVDEQQDDLPLSAAQILWLFDAYANGAGRIVVRVQDETIADVTRAWTDVSADQLAGLAALVDWRDSQGLGVRDLFLPITLDAPAPTPVEFEAFAAAVGSAQTSAWESDMQPTWVMLDMWAIGEVQAISAWVADIADSAETILAAWSGDGRVALNAAFGLFSNPDGTTGVRSASGALAGAVARRRWHESIGWVAEGGLRGCLGVRPQASEIDYLDADRLTTLNDARVITIRQWPGYGFVPTDDHMVSRANDDYQNIRYRRIIDGCIELVRLAQAPFTNSPGVEAADLEAMKAELEVPLRRRVKTADNPQGSITDYLLTLTPDADVLTNGVIHGALQVVPVGTKKVLNATFKLVREIA